MRLFPMTRRALPCPLCLLCRFEYPRVFCIMRMVTASIFTIYSNDARADKLIMSTELLNPRIEHVTRARRRRGCVVSADEQRRVLRTIIHASCDLSRDCCGLVALFAGQSHSFKPSLRRVTWSMQRWQLRSPDTLFDSWGRAHRTIDVAPDLGLQLVDLDDAETRGNTHHYLNHPSDSEAESSFEAEEEPEVATCKIEAV